MAALPAMADVVVGEVVISGLVERNGPWRTAEAMFGCPPEAADAHLAQMPAFLYEPATRRMVIAYQSFVVRTPRRLILVDTCSGEDKGYPAPLDFPKQPWLDRFHALGLDFAAVDYVLCTHMHFDHTGWNTRLENGRWVPTFPNARYVFHRREYAFWEAAAARGENPQGNRSDVWEMNCRPVMESGQAVLVDEDFALDDTVFLSLAPGHSPGHCCVEVRSRGEAATLVGDLMHHPLQCREPGWSTRFDWDPEQAAEERRRRFAELAEARRLVIPSHFPPPTAGWIERDEARFRYRFRPA